MGAHDAELKGAEADHDHAEPHPAGAAGMAHGAEAVVAGGKPEEVAAFLAAHPDQRDQVLRVLHQQRGNAFVSEVMALADDDTVSVQRAKANGPVGYRFGGDGKLGEVEQGGAELKVGDISPSVRKVQHALRELGYMPLPVTGTFDKHTEARVKEFQVAENIARTDGVVDSETFIHIEQSFFSLKKYAEIAQNEAPGIKDNPKEADADNPETALMRNTHTLGDAEKAEANDALTVKQEEVTAGGKTKEKKFKEHVKAGSYGKRIEKDLQFAVDELYKGAAAEKADHEKGQTFEMSHMVDIGNAAKGAVDSVFGSYAVGPKFEAGVNLKDRLEADTAAQAEMGEDARYWAAYSRAEYFMNAYDHFEKIDREHNANRTRAKEKGIIEEVLDRIARKNEKKIMVISASFPASMSRKGVMKIQRVKTGDTAKDRELLWTKFGSAVHEYLHSLTHSRWHAFRDQKDQSDPQAGHALAEGAAEFLTRVALSTVNLHDEKLRSTVEGSLPEDESFQPNADREGKYDPAYQRISRLVGTVGTYNFYAAYFLGQTQLIGA